MIYPKDGDGVAQTKWLMVQVKRLMVRLQQAEAHIEELSSRLADGEAGLYRPVGKHPAIGAAYDMSQESPLYMASFTQGKYTCQELAEMDWTKVPTEELKFVYKNLNYFYHEISEFEARKLAFRPVYAEMLRRAREKS